MHSIFPSKSEIYIPKDIFAFVAGLIDGDGYAKIYSAEIVQTYQESLMKYLMKRLEFSRYKHKIITFWGKSGLRITYYVPAKTCKILIDKNYCVKLLRMAN